MDDGHKTNRRTKLALIALGAGSAGWLLAPNLVHADCAVPPSVPPICLSGTITAKGHDRALVERTGVPGSEWLRAGERVLGWKIVEIGPGYIVVESKDQMVRLEPADQAGTVVHAEPVAAAHGTAAKAGTVKQGPLRQPPVLVARGEREAPE